jgi:transposase InsO family protein
MAIRQRQPPALLVHHTDGGGQYASGRYRAVLRRAGIRRSMSQAANVYHDAFMESCFGTIKTELGITEYDDYRDARREIAGYIAYYRTERKHSAPGYTSARGSSNVMWPLNHKEFDCPRNRRHFTCGDWRARFSSGDLTW